MLVLLKTQMMLPVILYVLLLSFPKFWEVVQNKLRVKGKGHVSKDSTGHILLEKGFLQKPTRGTKKFSNIV